MQPLAGTTDDIANDDHSEPHSGTSDGATTPQASSPEANHPMEPVPDAATVAPQCETASTSKPSLGAHVAEKLAGLSTEAQAFQGLMAEGVWHTADAEPVWAEQQHAALGGTASMMFWAHSGQAMMYPSQSYCDYWPTHQWPREQAVRSWTERPEKAKWRKPKRPYRAPKQEDVRAASLATETAAALSQQNFKSALNELIMKAVARPTTPEDVVYCVTATGMARFQATVKVVALDADLEFEGSVCRRKKDAEQSAARAAMYHYMLHTDELAMARSEACATRRRVGAQKNDEEASADDETNRAEGTSATSGVVAGSGPRCRLATSPMNLSARALLCNGGIVARTEATGGNFKSSLNEVVMKLCGTPLRPGDVTYEVQTLELGDYQATVKVAIKDERHEFQGEVRERRRDAEQSCAREAVVQLVESMKTGRGFGDGLGLAMEGGWVADASPDQAITNYKSVLNELTMRVANRPLNADDIVYTSRAIGAGQFQASVKASAIDDEIEFQGEVRARKRDAEQSAAFAALEHFSHEADLPARTGPLGFNHWM